MTTTKYKIYASGILFFLFVILCAYTLAEATTPTPAKISNDDCFSCHLDNPPLFDQKAFNNSVHQSLDCIDCHKDIKDLPHPDKLQPVDCSVCHEKESNLWINSDHAKAMMKESPSKASCSACHGATHAIIPVNNTSSQLYWANIPKTCGQCHQKEYKEYSIGIHGQALAEGSRDTPVCTDCHGEHDNDAVKRASSRVSSANIPHTCGQCHSAERINTKYGLSANVFDSYMQSYHGLALQQGTVIAANCASCHGAHEILPSSDPRSTINPKNLEKTCGQCHPGMSSEVTHGSIHGGFTAGNNPTNDLVRNFYIFLIFFVSSILLLHNLLDFSKKAMVYYRHSLKTGRPCMGANERWQHFILAATFILLSYTGFSLMFPQTWWSSIFFGHNAWLRWGHRGTGLVFSGLALYHLYYLFFTKNGRWQLNALSIRQEDFVQFFQSFQYYLGHRREKPQVGVYSYVQKLEYWALLWGSLVMVLTGVLMFSEVGFLGLFPKWLYDVVRTVHAYEAILACVTIIIWHGYFVIFDPDVYPGNFSWLHGRHHDKLGGDTGRPRKIPDPVSRPFRAAPQNLPWSRCLPQ